MESDTAHTEATRFEPNDSDHRRRVDRLADAVLERSPDDRRAFIEEACAGDEVLARDVERLLASCDSAAAARDFLSGTAAAFALPLLEDLDARSALGEMSMPPALASALSERYAVDRPIGKGGSATVFLAHDRAGGSPVAIKVLRPELAELTAATRFVREIRLMSELHHPRILPVLDAGGEGANSPYYVLPYMPDGSLRDRLASEGQLAIRDAVTVGRTIAEALHHAHLRGLIHRDVKPENILFSGDDAYLADFGIARALERAQGESSTTTGLVRGTVPYMSPEQASGSHDLDGRSDVYSLGCVIYELLAGVPAFVGPSAAAILAQKLSHAPRALRVYRPGISPRLEAVVMRALHTAPADRYRTAGELADALAALGAEDLSAGERTADVITAAEPPYRLSRLSIIGAIGLALTVGTLLLTRDQPRSLGSDPAASRPDTTIIALLPLERDPADGAPSFDDDHLFHDAVSWWRGITVIDRFRVAEAAARGARELTARDAFRLAASLGARRYVRGSLHRQGEHWRLYTALFDIDSAKALHQGSVTIPPVPSGAAAAYARIARSLLLRTPSEDSGSVVDGPTRSLPAAQAMVHAQSALDNWDLAAADSALQTAVRFDAEYVGATLSLAQVRAWRGLAPSSWASLVERVHARRARLSPREASLAAALRSLADARYEDACAVYDELRHRDDQDFDAWYGLGMCRTMDRGVVRDAASPTGWRFRSSYHRAVEAYTRAFEILPSLRRGSERGAFEGLMRTLLLVGTDVVIGHGVDRDSAVYHGRPAWMADGDTLALIAYPWETVSLGAPGATPQGFAQAIEHLRRRLRDIADGWSAAYPWSSGVKQTVAISLELVGDPAAIDTMRLARELATDPGRKLDLGVAEVLLRVKFGIPSNVRELEAARLLADSLLKTGSPTAVGAEALAPLAAITGQCGRAEALARRTLPLPSLIRIPRHLQLDAQVLLALNSLGCSVGPSTPSLRDLATALASDPAASLPGQQQLIDATLLFRPALLGYPLDSVVIDRIAASNNHPLIRAARALTRADTTSARATLSEYRTRLRVNQGQWTPDMVYPGASLLVAIGDTAAAVEWLDLLLGRTRSFDSRILADPVRTATLMRAVVLRAELATGTRDRAAAHRWGAVVRVLWRGADAELSDVVRRMTWPGGPP